MLKFKFSGLTSCGGDVNAFLRGDGFVGLVDDVFAAERLVRRAVQFGRAADGVEEILQMRLVRRLVEGHGISYRASWRRFAHIHLGGVAAAVVLGAQKIFRWIKSSQDARALLAVNGGTKKGLPTF